MFRVMFVMCLLSTALASVADGQEAAIVFNVNVVSDNTPDVSSLEALLKSITTADMTDEQKATAVWRMLYESRFWNPSSRGNLRVALGGTDPIITLNCFAPTICQQDAEMAIALWGLMGLDGRMWQLGWHTTPEVWYGGKWRHFDSTLGKITRDSSGQIGSVTLRKKLRGRKNWMRPNSYVAGAEGISLGHRMGMTLRSGEVLTRYWGPLGKTGDYWCASSDGNRPDNRVRRGRRRLADSMKLKERCFKPMPDDAAYGNGRWDFTPALGRRDAKSLLADSENIVLTSVDGQRGLLQPAAAGKQAWATFRLKSPYVFTGGWLSATYATGNRDDEIEVLASVDHGRSWRSLWKKPTAGTKGHSIALRDVLGEKFDCLVRFRMFAKGDVERVSIGDVKFESFVMNNPFCLPALKLGKTNITVAAGPQTDSLAIHPCMASADYRAFTVADFNTITSAEAHVPDWLAGLCCKKPGKESYFTIKVTTPGDMKKLRWGGDFADDNDNNKLLYSFDGKTWINQPWTYTQRIKDSKNERRSRVALYETLTELPPGTRDVWLKYWFFRPAGDDSVGARLLTSGIRIDADYAPPKRTRRPPIRVTYCWDQYDGKKVTTKTHTKIVDTYPTRYGIIVKGDKPPTMKWVSVSVQAPPVIRRP